MKALQKNDYVILNKKYKNLERKSVGIILDFYSPKFAMVFFIGKKEDIKINIENLKFLNIHKTGKHYKNKICNVCHVLKDYYRDFDINQTDANGVKTTRPSCKSCRIKIDGQKLKTAQRRRLEEIKPELYFVCPICKKGCIPDVTAKLVIDHDHITGEAREWICDSCNTGLGRFKDDTEILSNVIEYLKKYKKALKK